MELNMDNANTMIYDGSVDRAAMVRLYEERTSSKVNLIVDGHAIRVDKLVKESKLQGKSYQEFLKKLDAEINNTMAAAHSTTSRSLVELFSDQTSHTVQNLNRAVGDIWRTKAPPRQIAEDIVLRSPIYNNTTLENGWNGIGLQERKRIDLIIRKGIAEGQTENAIADTLSNGAFAITKQQAKGLVVTATTHVYSSADHEVYKANENLISGWQYVAVLDSRTTPLCAHRDGAIYPVSDTAHLPPAHWYCRSTTIPVVKAYDDLAKLEGIAQIRKRNLTDLTAAEIAKYDGQSPLKESYNQWLLRQSKEVQLRHLGDTKKLEMFRAGQLTVDKFTNPDGNSVGIKELRGMTDSGYGTPGDTRRFAAAKEKLDTLKLGAARPEELYEDPKIQAALKEYYLLQSGELDGTMSLTNYRGTLLHNKKATKQRVLASPPREEQMKFNPITGVYNDSRMYQPSPDTLANAYRNVIESDKLLDKDKEFLKSFVDGLDGYMGVNERAVVTENLRITIGRFRENKEPWGNMKAVLNGQVKFDVMNVSDYMETQLRKDANVLLKLKQSNYIDPVLGPVQLDEIHDKFIANVIAKNKWEDTVAPKIGKELRNVLDYKIPVKLKMRLTDDDLDNFYLRFAKRLSLADNPDRDQVAVALGRDLYNMANYRGARNEWYNLGLDILDTADEKGFYKLETFGVQKRRMKSRSGGSYFGPYYDTFAVNLRIVDPRIQQYAKLTRKVELGLRVPSTSDVNKLYIRQGYKTYFADDGLLGFYDTRIPITSTSSFSDFPVAVVDKDMAAALNWAGSAKYKIDTDFHDFIESLLSFQDDKGKAQYYHDLNKYREYMLERGDAYERLKAMKWLRSKDASFSNAPFLDHRARIYERGLIGPQSGETFRPFLNTAKAESFSAEGYLNLQDQIGAFLGGASDKLEYKYNSLSVTGRQQIAMKWKPDMVQLGDYMRRGKPNDIRKLLEHPLMAEIDGEEQGKLLRFALEMSRINEHLGGVYNAKSLATLSDYKIALALEQDASSSGAQIIALTTKNKQLAELSNVVPTTQKRRLYDEIAASTYNDPAFRELNKRFGLTEKDLRKGAKQQNMVRLYGAGKRTGILAVESKLGKVLGTEGTLVVKAADRDTVLSEISARMARYEKIDPEMYKELKALRQDVKDVFNKGLQPGDDLMEQLYFLDSKTKDLVEKMTREYDRVVTPDDFQAIANIMTSHLERQVPILNDFSRYYGRLGEAFMLNSKPSESAIDGSELLQTLILGSRKKGAKLPKWLSRILAIKDESVKQQLLRRIPGYIPGGTLSKLVEGVDAPTRRRTGFKLGKYSLFSEDLTKGIEIGIPNKLDKKWTNIPAVNFDRKVLEQNFTQVFEEKLSYKDKDGKWVTNILQVPQKTEGTWWEELRNKDNKINDIADAGKARTAYGVNSNHANDATIVKNFHIWGRKNNIPTSTIHDAFFANAAQMVNARAGLREIYANAVDAQSLKWTLDEMLARGFPRKLYDKYLDEAERIGLIPVPGKSIVGGKKLTKEDILTKSDIMKLIPKGFGHDYSFYGIG
jgi:SPP1 gp7 family putative phage head morphogenesis protein